MTQWKTDVRKQSLLLSEPTQMVTKRPSHSSFVEENGLGVNEGGLGVNEGVLVKKSGLVIKEGRAWTRATYRNPLLRET